MSEAVTLGPAAGGPPPRSSDSVAVRPARILVASDNSLVRTGVEAILRDESDLQIAADVHSAAAALSSIQRLRPNLLLLDVRMSGGSYVDALRRLRHEPELRILLLAAGIEFDEVHHAMELGARGVLFEDTPPALIVKSIRAVLRGEYWVTRRVIGELAQRLTMARGGAGAAVQRVAASTGHRLTRRERDIINLIVEGRSAREIAGRLRVHENTINRHLNTIHRKLGTSDRGELARFTTKRRLTDC